MNKELLQRRAVHLALRGKSFHRTNPMVGSIIYDKPNKVLSEGWHTAFGHHHAEREAILRFLDNYPKSELQGKSICVTLEPCNIHGKTPPCTDIIIDSKIDHVLLSNIDPNPLMKGKSLDILSTQGISYQHHPHKDSDRLIRSFEVNQQEKRPYIILKFAQSSDGFISKKNTRVKISNPTVDHLVHKWRSEVDGILIGRKTLEIDNPSLTTRLYFGPSPMRFLLTHSAIEQTHQYKFFQSSEYKQIYERGPESTQGLQIQNTEDLNSVLSAIYQENIGTLMIEGGANTLSQFIENDLWDEARIITSKGLKLNDGIQAPPIISDIVDTVEINDNYIDLYYN